MSLRPYLAVIRDSFHSALSSRVLWVAIIAIWLLLALLSPFGYREDFTTEFRGQDFHNGTRMKGMLARGLMDASRDPHGDFSGDPTAIGKLATAMPQDLQRQLRRVGEGDEVRIRYSVLTDALNGLLDDESWYDAEVWQSSLRMRELRELDEQPSDSLSDSLRRRRARLRIEAAMPGVFQARASRSILLTYAGLDFPTGSTIDKPQFEMLVNQFVLPMMINWLLGFVLIFLGILVTASIIPDMLQPGSLHLLLSKPVSRAPLLMSKFVGGCAFVLVCVTQLVIGLYLIAGLRLDIWNLRLMGCIPASVFLFAVFYSVSVLAGLRWRSPILAIGVTVIFGGVCLLVGFIGGLFDGLVLGPDRLQHLAVVGDDLFATTRGGGLSRFDEHENRWIEIFESGPMNADRVIPPVTLDQDRMVTSRVRGGRFNPFGSGVPELVVCSRQDDWNPEPSLRLPTATTHLYASGQHSLFALSTGELAITDRASILQAAGLEDSADPKKDDKGTQALSPPTSPPDSASWLSKLNSMIGGATDRFQSVLPQQTSLTPPRAIVVDPKGQFLIAVSLGRIIRVDRPEEETGDSSKRWALTQQRTLEGDSSARSMLALSGDRLLLARGDHPLRILDVETLQEVGEVEVPTRLSPLQIAGVSVSIESSIEVEASGDAFEFLVVTSDGRCRQITSSSMRDKKIASFAFRDLPRIGPAEIETVHYDRPSHQIHFAHHVDCVDVMDQSTFKTISRIRPQLDSWRLVHRWGIAPLRWIIPQTGALGETIAAMISGKSAMNLSGSVHDGEQVRYKIFGPVLSCSLFTIVMLSVSCLYFSTRDF